jgi:hypothetical protein
MDKKLASERLRALASDDNKRSKAARLRDVIDDVETALLAGVTRAAVIEELAALGLEMSLATFETTLKRIRQKRGTASSTRETPVGQIIDHGRTQNEAAATVRAVTDSEATVEASHDPADLDRIIGTQPDLDALAKFAKRKKR